MYNALWIHSLPYSKFIELTLTYWKEYDDTNPTGLSDFKQIF